MSSSFSDNECCPTNSNCYGGRGITYWSLGSTTIPCTGSRETTFTFTPTSPKCYSGKDICLATFYSYPNGNSSSDISVGLKLNSDDPWGSFCLPGTMGFGGWQDVDLAYVSSFHENEINTLTFHNYGDVDITLSGLSIYNIYQMNNLDWQAKGWACMPDQGTGNGDDYPCNYEKYGKRSYSYFYDRTYDQHTLNPSSTFSWTINWSNYSGYNYEEKDICLFNFNKVHATSSDPNNKYVQLDAYINGLSNHLATYYISNTSGDNHCFFPSYDLTQSSQYSDTGTSTIILKNNGTVPVKMADGFGINVYRVYKTKAVHSLEMVAGAGCASISPSASLPLHGYVHGETVELGAWPSYGYNFSHWTINGSFYVGIQFPQVVMAESYTMEPIFTSCSSCYTCDTCVSCQTTCELECQDCQNCEIACMTECNVSCQTTCETTCQTGCEVGCQTGCEVACQTGCEVACQTGCEVSCQTGCEVGCETCQDCQYCEVMCMTPCDLCETN
jgi:hypothetical protein